MLEIYTADFMDWKKEQMVGCFSRQAQTEEEEDQSLKLALGKPWVWSVSDLIHLATAYEGGWPVTSLTVKFYHWQCVVSVLIVAELARERRWNRNLKPNFCLCRDLNPEPHDWQSSMLTTRPLLLCSTPKSWLMDYHMCDSEVRSRVCVCGLCAWQMCAINKIVYLPHLPVGRN